MNMVREKSRPFIETVTEGTEDYIIASKIRWATEKEVVEAEALFKQSKEDCPHTIRYDKAGWPYDYRFCYICGKGIGTI